MVGQGECAGFTFFGGCCGELLRGGTRGRPRAASRRPRHGCTTNARQTDSLFSLARSLGVKQSTFFFLNFKYLTTRDFYSQGSETLHFKCRGEEMEISVAEKFQHFPELVECSWLYRAHGRRRSSTKQKKKKRDDGGVSSDWVGGHGRRQSGGSAFTPEGLPPGSNLRLLVAPRRASVRRF